MGQYYEIILEDENGERVHYDRSINGEYQMAKLTEHSWWLNPTMYCVCELLRQSAMRVYWVGDYADNAAPVNNMGEKMRDEIYHCCWGETAIPAYISSLPSHTFSLSEDPDAIESNLTHRYLVNITKGLYIDCDAYYKRCVRDGWCTHPLSLLTAMGNGQGGGDYHGINEEKVGSWAGDLLSVEDEVPLLMKEYVIDFIEE